VNNPKAAYQETIYDPFSCFGHAVTALGDWIYVAFRARGLCPACADAPAALSAARAGAAAGRRNVAVYRSYAETT